MTDIFQSFFSELEGITAREDWPWCDILDTSKAKDYNEEQMGKDQAAVNYVMTNPDFKWIKPIIQDVVNQLTDLALKYPMVWGYGAHFQNDEEEEEYRRQKGLYAIEEPKILKAAIEKIKQHIRGEKAVKPNEQ